MTETPEPLTIVNACGHSREVKAHLYAGHTWRMPRTLCPDCHAAKVERLSAELVRAFPNP